MTQSQPLAIVANCHSWEGRIVNGKYPLRQYLSMSEALAVYLTDVAGATALITLAAADAAQARAHAASWKLGARLSHPNLVRVFDTGLWHADDERDMQFAVMEYCDESLAGVLRQRAITADESRVMLAPMLDAIKYLHRNGVQHGQISPANVLAIGEQLKLSTDYLRRCTDPDVPTTATVYDAPEKAAGMPSLSSDTWSLGVTLCEALTRRLPVLAKDGNLELPEKLPAPLDEMVRGCLTPDRERRLSIAAIGRLLERPAPELVKAPKAEDKSSVTPVADLRMVRPSTPNSYAAEEPGGEAGTSPGSTAAGRKPIIVAAVALVLVFVILVAARFGRAPAPPSSATAAPQTASTAPFQPSVTAGSARAPATATGTVARQVMPEISGKARDTIHGTVKVRVKVAVTADGTVSRASLMGHAPSAYFARQSLEAARQWTFAPPSPEGKAQPSEWALQFEFRRSGTHANAHRV